MASCGERISLTGRGGKQITPTFAYPCELPSDHEGPHSSPSDMSSVKRRTTWEQEDLVKKAEKRHADSGMIGQSLPLTSSSITQPGTQRPHPSSPTTCPFCPEMPMVKEFESHVRTHIHGDGSPEVPVDETVDKPDEQPPNETKMFGYEWSPSFPSVAHAVPMPPKATETERAAKLPQDHLSVVRDVLKLDRWILGSNPPESVVKAWDSICRLIDS